MARQHRGNGLVVSIWGAAGVFLVGFFGAEALFAPASEGLPLSATLIPSLIAAGAAFAYLMTQRTTESVAEEAEVPAPTPLRRPAPSAAPAPHSRAA
jgi:hypothetical protein